MALSSIRNFSLLEAVTWESGMASLNGLRKLLIVHVQHHYHLLSTYQPWGQAHTNHHPPALSYVMVTSK